MRMAGMMESMISDITTVGEDELLNEAPSSWHHVTRMRCLNKGTRKSTRCLWYTSTVIMVSAQILVMMSFSSSLSVKRCLWQPSDEEGECDDGSYCAGMNTLRLSSDPLSPHSEPSIRLGFCHGCGTRLPDEKEVPELLELMCPVSDVIASCMAHCAAPTNDHDFLMYTHVSTYSSAELSCASACAGNATASLASAEAAVFADALVGGRDIFGVSATSAAGLPHLAAFAVWLSIIQQCVACPESLRTGVAYMTASENENNILLKMSLFDHIALALCAVIVALTLTREVRDINIGKMMTLQAKERDRQRDKGELTDLPKGEHELTEDSVAWEWALGGPVALRRYIIIPDVAATVVLMVLRMGGDTVSVMLNTLAALFMLEVDNLAFDYGLTAQTKARVETEFNVVLGAEQIWLLNAIRRWHVITLSIYLILSVNFIALVHDRSLRQRLLTLLLIAILGLGEFFEYLARRKRRTTSENVQRFAMLVVKVGLAAVFKWYVIGLQWGLAPISAYW